MRLSIVKSGNLKAIITLKSKKFKPFVAKVKEFLYDEEDIKISLNRCKETIFPTDKDGMTNEGYIVYTKNIKSVNPYHEK